MKTKRPSAKAASKTRVPAKTKTARTKTANTKATKNKSRAAQGTKGNPAGKGAAKPVSRALAKPAVKGGNKSPRNPTLATALAALEDMKAVDVRVLDVRGVSDVTDYMVIASGNSDRHLRSIADRVVQMAKASGQRPLGLEGEQQGEWVLVDLPDVMVHLMLPRTREFYQLEQLWEPAPKARNGRGG